MTGEFTSWRHQLFTKHQAKERDRLLRTVERTVKSPINNESIVSTISLYVLFIYA